MTEREKELLQKVNDNFKELSLLKNYNFEKYLYSLYHHTSQLIYFYRDLAENKRADKINYNLKMETKIHTLIYVNIGRGFPKELMDGHWCYVVKDYKSKLLVIPSTSIKTDSRFNKNYDMDIESIKNKKIFKSRLCITEMRCIDKQRIDIRKGYSNVITDRSEILSFIYKNILD